MIRLHSPSARVEQYQVMLCAVEPKDPIGVFTKFDHVDDLSFSLRLPRDILYPKCDQFIEFRSASDRFAYDSSDRRCFIVTAGMS